MEGSKERIVRENILPNIEIWSRKGELGQGRDDGEIQSAITENCNP